MSAVGEWLRNPALQGMAALAAVATAAAGAVGWLNRRRHPAPIGPVQFSGRAREAFLERVWSQRIVNGLQRSLQHATEMHLDLRNAPELVTLSYAQSTSPPGGPLTVEVAYAESGQQLVIVGPPGSGKTTEALRLMRQLLEAARGDPSAPVPEIFPLASWAAEPKPLIEWLAERLQLRHGGRAAEWEILIAGHRVMAVLDGLDEVDPEHRAACLREINAFWETQGREPLVLCCRLAEYEQLAERVKFGGAVIVSPPGEDQIDAYLSAAGPGWDGVRAELRACTSASLRELLATPLMLSVAVLAFQGADPDELCGAPDAGGQRDLLWGRYVTAMQKRGYDPAGVLPDAQPSSYQDEQVMRWLGWIAFEMRRMNRTELWLHEWNGPGSFHAIVRGTAGLVVALVVALVVLLVRGGMDVGMVGWMVAGVVYGVVIGVLVRPAPAFRRKFDRLRLLAGLAGGFAGGVLGGVTRGLGNQLEIKLNGPGLVVLLAEPVILLVTVLAGGFAGRLAGDRVVGRTRGRTGGLIAGLMGGFIVSIFGRSGTLLSGLFVGLVAGLVVGLVVGLIFGLVGQLPIGGGSGLTELRPASGRVAPRSPTQLVRDSGRIGLTIGLLVALVFGLVAGLAGGLRIGLVYGLTYGLVGLTYGLAMGLAVGLATGLGCPVHHYAFRLWLRSQDRGPLRWPHFLAWASDHLLLQTTGASYQWVHLELRDYLAEQQLLDYLAEQHPVHS